MSMLVVMESWGELFDLTVSLDGEQLLELILDIQGFISNYGKSCMIHVSALPQPGYK